jgi:hypothetical protein
MDDADFDAVVSAIDARRRADNECACRDHLLDLARIYEAFAESFFRLGTNHPHFTRLSV